MADTELSSKLYEKASAEQDKFRAWLMDQPPADILNHAVEYAVREDILMEIGALELPDDQARALLASPDTMADIYKTFSKMSDTGHMDVVRECIEDRADTLIKSGILSQPQVIGQEAMRQTEQEVVEIFGVKALFLDERVRPEDVPEGLYRYELRGSDVDPGDPALVENRVIVNHAGTILAAKPLDIPKEGFLELGDELNFTGDAMTVDAFRGQYASVELDEAVYLVDRSSLLHVRENMDGDYEYAVFDKQTKEKTAEGRISLDDVQDGIDPTHDHLAAARDAAVRNAGLDGIEVAQVGLTSLKAFPKSDIYRRSIWEPETLPKDDIRFINSGYDEQFRIPDGGTIQVEYPDRTFSAKCGYIDDYHTYVGSEVYHICQFAEVLERGGGVCRPEPVLDAEQAAWKIGWNAYLAVECGAGHWDYHLYDEKFNETKGGELEVVGCSINEVRDMVLAENKLERRSMTPTDHGMLMEKAAMREQEAQAEKRESVLGQLSALKTSAKERPAPTPAKKRDEASL